MSVHALPNDSKEMIRNDKMRGSVEHFYTVTIAYTNSINSMIHTRLYIYHIRWSSYKE